MLANSEPTNASVNDPARQGVSENELEIAIGQQVRAFRTQLRMTVAELAGHSGLSPVMLSKSFKSDQQALKPYITYECNAASSTSDINS